MKTSIITWRRMQRTLGDSEARRNLRNLRPGYNHTHAAAPDPLALLYRVIYRNLRGNILQTRKALAAAIRNAILQGRTRRMTGVHHG